MKSYRLLICFLVAHLSASGQVKNIYVSVRGNDNNAGTPGKPFRTLERALQACRNFSGKASVQLLGGTYYLARPVTVNSNDNMPASLEIKAYKGQKVIISAGRKLNTQWQLFKKGIYQTAVPADADFERLFVNGVLQTLARYPNADTTSGVFSGTAEDATYYVRVLSWGNPVGGYVHALDENRQGSLHYKITGVDDTDNVELAEGWQHPRPVHRSKKFHFVENILAELDQPGEWYLDKTLHVLYYYPSQETDLSRAEIEVSGLKNSITLAGSPLNPLRHVSLKGLEFRHNERTFSETKEAVEGSDWAVYRGGALLLSGTENCVIENCTFTDLGGNAVMLSGYNQHDTIRNCVADHVGGNAISMISSKNNHPGGSGKIFSRHCAILDNTIHYPGEIEKRGTGIYLYGARESVIQGNSMVHVPGSAIRSEGSSENNNQFINNMIADEFREIKY